MAWQPPSEEALVECSVEARQGVRFDLWVGESQLCYSRLKALAYSDPLETVIIERNVISDVVLKKKSPLMLRAIGLLLIAGTTAGVVAFIIGTIDHIHLELLLGYVLGGACFLGSSNRWQLAFRAGTKRHKIVQPVSSDKATMNAMANAIQSAGGLLLASSTAATPATAG